MRLFAYHENPESVVALLNALSRQVEVHAFRVVSPGAYLHAKRGQDGFYWASVAGAAHQGVALVPGLRRAKRLSKLMLDRSHRSAIRKHGKPDFVLIDSPYLAPWAMTLAEPLAYLATDPYRFYGWPTGETDAYERQILQRASATFPVSELLAEEFRAQGARRVVRLPNGVGTGFAERARGPVPTPLDLAGLPRPTVAVVGMINATYDWDLIEALSAARPDVSFVFIGPIREEDIADRRRIDGVLARSNVHWLGPRPHAELPSYLNGCDLLLNPLTVNDHNDRRFPLRVCEYLATDRPILTTAIHEVKWFAPHVEPFADSAAALVLIERALAGEVVVDMAGRRDWLERNSWDARATEALEALQSVAAGMP